MNNEQAHQEIDRLRAALVVIKDGSCPVDRNNGADDDCDGDCGMCYAEYAERVLEGK